MPDCMARVHRWSCARASSSSHLTSHSMVSVRGKSATVRQTQRARSAHACRTSADLVRTRCRTLGLKGSQVQNPVSPTEKPASDMRKRRSKAVLPLKPMCLFPTYSRSIRPGRRVGIGQLGQVMCDVGGDRMLGDVELVSDAGGRVAELLGARRC